MGTVRVNAVLLSAAIALAQAGCTSPKPPLHPVQTRTPTPSPNATASRGELPSASTYRESCDLVSSWCQPIDGSIPPSLSRPLAFPGLATGGRCPTTHGAEFATSQFGGIALGRWPVQPLIVPQVARDRGPAKKGILRFRNPPEPSGWRSLKTLWFGKPTYQGLVLIRGREIGGSNKVAFGEELSLVDPQLPPGPTINGSNGWRQWPGGTWVQAPGCYGWQIDGVGFSHVIIFEAQFPG
jgi:hypothetical protein